MMKNSFFGVERMSAGRYPIIMQSFAYTEIIDVFFIIVDHNG